MKFRFTGFYFWMGITICLTTSLVAQSNDSVKYFRTLGWATGPSETLYYTQSELPPLPDQDNPKPLPGPDYKDTALTISGSFRSIFYVFDPAKPLFIVRHNGFSIELVASINLSNGPTDPLLFIRGNEQHKYEVQIIDDSVATFPGGSFLVFNYSSFLVQPGFKNQTGITNLTVDKGQSKKILPTFVDQKVTTVTIRLPELQKLVYSSNWVLKNDERNIVFLIDNPSDKTTVNFLRVSDRTEELVHPAQTP